MTVATQPPLLPSLSFTIAGKKKKKAIRSIFDNIKLLFPVVKNTAPAPIPPAPSSSLPVYTSPIRISGGGGGGTKGFNQVNMV